MISRKGGVGIYIFMAIIFVLGMMFIGGFFNNVFKKSPVELIAIEDEPTAEEPIKAKPLEFTRGPDKPITIGFYNNEGVDLYDVKPTFSCSGLTLAGQSTNVQNVKQGEKKNWVVMIGIMFATMPGSYNCEVKVSETKRTFSFLVE